MANVLLISTYELGHQPFGLASPAAWLQEAGANVSCLDLAVEPLNRELVAQAEMIAFYLPMHTATRLAVELIPIIKDHNPRAILIGYGLYAATNANYLRQLGLDQVIGGEFETTLVTVYQRQKEARENTLSGLPDEPSVSLERQQFLTPARQLLPSLDHYATLALPDGQIRQVGYVEASRGCKHLCRHCPIVPVYNGRFRIVQAGIVLDDIRQQVAAGAEHITFGDPDFLNGPGHTVPIVQALHREFPELTFDVTIKVEHLLQHDHLLPVLRQCGCLFVTSAVEALADPILEILDKGHTRADFVQAATRLRELDLVLNPTFVAFTPWTSPHDYLDMLATIEQLGLIENVAPIQYAIRLLIPAGSRLLELPEVKNGVGDFDQAALSYPWQHPYPAMDELYKRVYRLVQLNSGGSRPALFARIWQEVLDMAPGLEAAPQFARHWDSLAAPVPRLSESWY